MVRMSQSTESGSGSPEHFIFRLKRWLKKGKGGNGVGGDSTQPVYLISHIDEIGLVLSVSHS